MRSGETPVLALALAAVVALAFLVVIPSLSEEPAFLPFFVRPGNDPRKIITTPSANGTLYTSSYERRKWKRNLHPASILTIQV